MIIFDSTTDIRNTGRWTWIRVGTQILMRVIAEQIHLKVVQIIMMEQYRKVIMAITEDWKVLPSRGTLAGTLTYHNIMLILWFKYRWIQPITVAVHRHISCHISLTVAVLLSLHQDYEDLERIVFGKLETSVISNNWSVATTRLNAPLTILFLVSLSSS